MSKARWEPNGLHLFDRTSGWHVLMDEIAPPQGAVDDTPRFLSVALTNACDLDCPYCYAPKQPQRLPFDRVLSWARELSSTGCLGIGFGGGEPTLYPRFAELCTEITRETNLAVSFTTHGHWRDEATLARSLSGSVHSIRVSMDGTGATYEQLRNRSYLAFRDAVRRLRMIAPVGVNTVVNSRTLPLLTDVAEVACELGATEVLLLPEVSSAGECRLSEQDIDRFKAWLESNMGNYPLALAGASARLMEGRYLRCSDVRGADFELLHVDASSQLRRCAFSAGGIEIGDGISLVQAIAELRRAPRLAVLK
jgi:sulfatase maturation enzyme AslB (radical SAM superfamily)